MWRRRLTKLYDGKRAYISALSWVSRNNQLIQSQIATSTRYTHSHYLLAHCSTPEWRAPEFLELAPGARLDTAAAQATDLFSYGMILWELLTRQRPAEGYMGFRTTRRVRGWVGERERERERESSRKEAGDAVDAVEGRAGFGAVLLCYS